MIENSPDFLIIEYTICKNRAQNHNLSYLALITLINTSHMPHFEQILAESISQEKRYHSVPYLYYLPPQNA